MTVRNRIAATLALLIGLIGSIAAAQEDMSAIADAAAQERTVVLYTSIGEEGVRALADAFTERYGVQVDVFRAVSGRVLQRLESEIMAGNVGADVLLVPDIYVFESLAGRGELLAFVPPSTSAYREDQVTQFYSEVGSIGFAAAYNTDKVSPDEVPQTLLDLTHERWRGRLGLTDPNNAAALLQWYYLVRRELGVGFIEALAAQDVAVYSSNPAQIQALIAGEIHLSTGVPQYLAMDQKEAGAPIDYVYLEPMPNVARAIGIMADAVHPNAAKLLVEFALSAEGQEILGTAGKTFAAHPDAVLSVPGLPSLSELEVAALSFPEYADLQSQTTNLLDEFNRLFR